LSCEQSETNLKNKPEATVPDLLGKSHLIEVHIACTVTATKSAYNRLNALTITPQQIHTEYVTCRPSIRLLAQ